MDDFERGAYSISHFTRRAMIFIGLASLVAVLLYFAAQLLDVLLLVFAGALVAVSIDGMVRLPPAYTVVVQLAGAAVAGVAGVILSTPLAVVAVVAVQMLYVEDVLGDDVEVLGQGK
ncbi:hypothetical protein ACUY1T_21020 [Billgrantia sp. Q4P2]|uniref:hypothetical protein n=1 Tax=Billgrantia sp. Q4P2 TaxID=3463857 RepID=UPI004057A803